MCVYNEPFFSIIIPVFNVENYISQCLKTIIEQSFNSYEILCIDDGSTDSSGLICDEFSKEYSFIKTFHKNNEGLGLTRNYGLKRATGKYIFFIDSDDYIPSRDCLKKLHEKLSTNSYNILNINHCTCDYDTGEINEQSIRSVVGVRNSKFYFEKNFFTPSACFKIVDRTFIIDNKLSFETGISEDFLWTAKMLSKSPSIGYLIDEAYYCYRNYRPGSLTQSKDTNNIKQFIEILKKVIALNNKTETMEMFISKSFFDLFMTIVNKYETKSILEFNNIDFFYNNRYVLKRRNLKKSIILYSLLTFFGTKNTVKILKSLK